ncbi:MAG TPA: SgcJ/EcaC family oxidoreductase [Allosphingosinicella sp.]|nr:SgcJ/EcaC family oxidoreductase [Allosphingosinicella sp.]
MRDMTRYWAGRYVAGALAGLAILPLGGCGNRIDTETEAERLMQTSRDWSAAAQSRDVDRMLGYWAEDALIISPGEPERRGKAAIREYLLTSFAVPGFRISWEPLEATIAASGDLGYLIERTQVTVTGPEGRPLTQQFRAVTLWRKEADGAWRNVVDISNAPPRSDS